MIFMIFGDFMNVDLNFCLSLQILLLELRHLKELSLRRLYIPDLSNEVSRKVVRHSISYRVLSLFVSSVVYNTFLERKWVYGKKRDG